MSEWIKVIILGVVEGISEFLPISSTGHLIITSSLLDFNGGIDGTFEIFIQIGAVFAVLALYADDLLHQLRQVRTNPLIRELWMCVAIAFVPFALLGMNTRQWIKDTLFSPLTVAITLIAGGVVILWVERRRRALPETVEAREKPALVEGITWRQALVVGVAQMFALIPGVSRSAATIIGGMSAGMSRTAATEFSFLLAIPILGGATVYELVSMWDSIQPTELAYLLMGALVSAVVAWIAIRWLLRYVARHNFVPFAYYRIAAGVVVLLLIAAGLLPTGA